MHRLLAIFLLLCLTGCACFNRDNTPALNFVEARLVPKDPATRKVTYPLVIPVSIAAVTLDAFLLHPVSVIPDAAKDVRGWAWDKLDWKERYFTTSASVVPFAVFTPVAFTGSFLFRSLFDVSTPKPDPTRQDEEKLVRLAQKALEEQRLDEALNYAEKVLQRSRRSEALEVKGAVLLERGQIGELEKLRTSLRWSKETRRRFSHALKSATPADRIRLLHMVQHGGIYGADSEVPIDALLEVLQDQDRVVRTKAMEVLWRYNSTAAVRSALEAIAAQDDAVLAAEAGAQLRR